MSLRVAPALQRAGSALRAGRSEVIHLVVATLGLLLSASGWMAVDARSMGGFGLVELMTPAVLVGMTMIVIGFAAALATRTREALLGAYAIAFVTALHIGPVIAYGTLRLSWAWKHVGIIDYISRTGSVDPSIELLGVYHNWPGFFAGFTVLEQLAGEADALRIATVAPVAIVIANVFALRFVLRVLTPDIRRIWLGIWLFSILNWVGQDYFSPQALAFLLLLVLLGVVLRFFRLSPATDGAPPRVPASILVLILVLMAGIGWNHQITPIMATIALTALVATRRIHGWYLPVIMLLMAVAWALLIARGYASGSLGDLLVPPSEAVDQNLEKSEHLRGAAVIVSWAGRALVLAAALLAAGGAVRLLRRGTGDLLTIVLAGSPILLLVATAFGGETLFRIVLFSAPFLCLLAAAIVFPAPPQLREPRHDQMPARTGTPRVWRRQSSRVFAAVLSLTAVLTPTFFVAHNGNDRVYYFTPDEVTVVTDLLSRAPAGSLIVEGNTNYPGRMINYEQFRYVSIASEPEGSRDRLLADPASTLARWTSDARYPAGYVLITRAQKASSDTVGPMPIGALQSIEDALRSSPDFAVEVESRDAVVFEYIGGPGS